MIVPENTPKTPLKTSAKLSGEHGQSSSEQQPAPPPSYAAVAAGTAAPPQQPQGQGQVQPPVQGQQPPHPPGRRYHPSAHSEQAYYRYVENPHPRSVALRFFKAWLVAVLVWIVLGALVRSMVEVGIFGRNGRGKWDDYNYDIPSDIKLETCFGEGSGGPSTDVPSAAQANDQVSLKTPITSMYAYSVATSFQLPVTSETLFLLSRGYLSSGHLDISTSDKIDSKYAQVNVSVRTNRRDTLEATRVCQVTRGQDENGVGFFTPKWWSRRRWNNDRVFFDIKLTLPVSASKEISDSLLFIRNLETDLPNHVQAVGNLASDVDFRSISLLGSNAPITIHSFTASTASLKTSNSAIIVQSPTGVVTTTSNVAHSSNGPITGFFNATNHLKIETSNAKVAVRASLINTQKEGDAAVLVIRTSNGAIESSVDLISDTKSANPKFDVTTRTSNALNKFQIRSSPVDSLVSYQGRTSNHDADLRLPSTYEGSFNLYTSNSRTTLDVKPKETVRDPKGKGRQRTVESKFGDKNKYLSGEVYWEEGNRKNGKVVVHTSNAPVAIHL